MAGCRGAPAVSILTRPYGRMLYTLPGLHGLHGLFQSSPALTGGCYSAPATLPGWGSCFNPHPPLRADAIVGRRMAGHTDHSFNPHPPLRADAISARHGCSAWARLFQSSPALTGGCYVQAGKLRLEAAGVVSILTRPYGRMLCRASAAARACTGSFNPHPPLRADAIAPSRTARACTGCFNPHPPLRADAMPYRSRHQPPLSVSILTRPYGRMLSLPPPGGGVERPCFNPHPPLRADAILATIRQCGRVFPGFNPHPPLRADAISAGHAIAPG